MQPCHTFIKGARQTEAVKRWLDLQASASLWQEGVTVYPMHAVYVHSKSATQHMMQLAIVCCLLAAVQNC